MTTITVQVDGIKRLRNSINGNPRWLLTTTAIGSTGEANGLTATLPTAPDTMDAFLVCEPMVGKVVTLTLAVVGDRSQIIGIDWEGK